MPALPNLLDTSGFPPRWHCGSWSAELGWLHIGSDLAIFGAYFAIPVTLSYFLLRRRDLPFGPLFWLFAAFILSCGVGHAVEATLFWHPWYRLSGAIKFVTAVVSWATVLALIPLVPKALSLPGLAVVNEQLKAEIARRERAEAERLALERQMQQSQKMESLGVLAGGIAHDFNNLLTSIMGYADLARLELPADAPARPLLEEVLTGSLRAAELTNQMLAYSGRGQFVVQPVRLAEVVAGMARLLHTSVSKRCDLRLDAPPGGPAVEADVVQLRQVVMNLIINASEALDGADGTVTVTTGSGRFDRAYLSRAYLDDNRPTGEYSYLEVADTGCGMTDEVRAKIFDPFFTTKFTGRGLGLAAVLGIVRGHKGAIVVESERGKGTRFRVLFPTTAAAVAPAEPAARPDEWRGRGAVLVVDDEDAVRAVAAQMAAEIGFEVVTAADGRAGLDAFRREPDRFAAVLLDLTMPHLNGDEVFQELRRIRPDVRVILSSGYNEQAVRGLPAAAGFVQKPYLLADLRTAFRKALEGAGSRL